MRDFEVSYILLVTDSGAGAPLERLYLIPKSSFGPRGFASQLGWLWEEGQKERGTSGVVTGGEENAAGSLHLANDVAGSRSAHDAIVAQYEFFDAISSTNLEDQLHNIRVVEATIAADDEKGAIDTFRDGQQAAGNKGLAIVGLLEDFDLLAQAGAR